MKEEENIQTSIEQNVQQNVQDAVKSNPYAFQKITSKKLEIVENAKPVAKEQQGIPKKVSLIFTIIVLTGIVYVGAKFIYPLFIKKTYSTEEACKNPYECTDLGNGTSSCTFYDDTDKLQTVICPNSTSSDSTDETKDEEIGLSKEDANSILSDYTSALLYAGMLNNIFVDESFNVYNLFSNNQEKLRFAFYYAVESVTEDKIINNKDADGNEIEGVVGIDFTYFKDYYYSLFNIDFDSSILTGTSSDCVKDGYIYQNTTNTNNIINYVFKASSIVLTEKGYGINVDVLYFDSSSTDVNTFLSSDVVEYENSLIKYKLYVEIEKNSYDKYQITIIKEDN